jgi:hypothetical protein
MYTVRGLHGKPFFPDEAADPGQVLLLKALGLVHVDLNILELTIEVGIGDVSSQSSSAC